MFWKTQPPLIVNIPNPCHQNWQQMDVVERGRFCQACQTVVTDFSALSDDEIIKHIEQAAGGKMCGRFSEFQINRPLIPEIKVHRISALRKVAASVLMLYASLNEAVAQAPGTSHTTYSSANAKKPVTKTAQIIIKGKVIDFTGVGVPGLELQLQGTGIVKTTDAHGNFKMEVPDSSLIGDLTISPTPIGKRFLDTIGAIMEKNEVYVDTLPFKTSIVIKLYPIDTLEQVDIIQPFAVRMQSSTTGTVTTIIDPAWVPSKKKIAMQKFKNLFKSKKST